MPPRHSALAAAALALLGGLVGAAAWAPVNATWTAWVCLVPLFAALRGCGLLGAAALGWLWGAAYEAGVTWWVETTLARHTALASPAVVTLHMAMAGILAGSTALFAVAVVVARRHGHALWWAAPAAWVALEWARSQAALGFPWSHLGYTQFERVALIQMASLAGVHGLSALVVFVNATIAEAFRAPRHLALLRLAAAAAVLAAVVAGGALRLRLSTPPPSVLRLALVDGGVDEADKWQPEYAEVALGRYAQLTLAAAQAHPDLVVWPETALTFFLQDGGSRAARLVEVARQAGAPLLVGAPAVDATAGSGLVQYNRVYLLGADGREQARYDKQVLVPFGEYVPTRWLAARVAALAPAAAPIHAGSGPPAIPLLRMRAGVLVCYENVFAWLARRAVRDGARFLVNPSNDAWYAHTAAPAQQLAHVVLRAVELGVPVVRVANRGALVVADARGQLAGRAAPGEPRWEIVPVPLGAVPTPYSRWGDVFAAVCVAATLLALAVTRGGSPG